MPKASAYYEWRPGVVARIDAEVAGREMERLLQLHPDDLTEETIADYAADPESPLHPQIFHFGKEEAARKFYVDEAGKLKRGLNRVVIRETKSGPSEVAAPAFVTLGPAPGTKKRRIERSDIAMSDATMRATVLSQVRASIRHMNNKLDSLRGLGDLTPVLIELAEVATEAVAELDEAI